MAVSELQMNIPKRSVQQINAYFDGARAGIRLYAIWHDGSQYVGASRSLIDALNDLEVMRQKALEQADEL